MRPPRIAILVLFSAASFIFFCRFLSTLRQPSPTIAPLSTKKPSTFRSVFSFQAPFSLFPPNAAISLTDDNNTFFLARPAAFGPTLPSEGLSGQLWIGNGFSEDNLQEGGGEGELGCSDAPGWEDGRTELVLEVARKGLSNGKSTIPSLGPKNNRRGGPVDGPLLDRKASTRKQHGEETRPVNDGTDDYLHQRLQPPNALDEPSRNLGSSHADIQSIQETAEITGKIVLLSRGGCGFLEKVKWAQRRGAIALIVGDNQKHGPLIQMFARGNVDNVTIPSVFTSRTTAHLLSSLMQPGSFIEDILDENGRPILKVQQSGKGKKNGQGKERGSPSVAEAQAKSKPAKAPFNPDNIPSAGSQALTSRRSWISRLLWGADNVNTSDRRRTSTSGDPDLDGADGFEDENGRFIPNIPVKASKGSADGYLSEDDLQAGVQSSESKSERPKGGIVTPGSGEYSPGDAKSTGSGKSASTSQGGLMSKIFGDGETDDGTRQGSAGSSSEPSPPYLVEDDSRYLAREGLWVTITPTSSASPFWDTLLVLVVSPLITLVVVYALVMIRNKLRRRRWRAPKSVIDRLPVRTYQTVAPSPARSPRAPSPSSSSPTTPLLQGSSRPRSRTATGIPESDDALRADSSGQSSRPNPHEKRTSHGSSEWKKYMGRQVECAVCLEEYVDGVSRVMSLPCGHEFHPECITPWLTTRRRTCPICKGDVVRSLARGTPSNPRYEPYQDDSDEDIEAGMTDSDDEQGGSLAPGRPQGYSEWLQALAQAFGHNTVFTTRTEPPDTPDTHRNN